MDISKMTVKQNEAIDRISKMDMLDIQAVIDMINEFQMDTLHYNYKDIIRHLDKAIDKEVAEFYYEFKKEGEDEN